MYHQVLNHGPNVFTEQTSKGTFIRKNGELVKVLRKAVSIIKILGIRF